MPDTGTESAECVWGPHDGEQFCCDGCKIGAKYTPPENLAKAKNVPLYLFMRDNLKGPGRFIFVGYQK